MEIKFLILIIFIIAYFLKSLNGIKDLQDWLRKLYILHQLKQIIYCNIIYITKSSRSVHCHCLVCLSVNNEFYPREVEFGDKANTIQWGMLENLDEKNYEIPKNSNSIKR